MTKYLSIFILIVTVVFLLGCDRKEQPFVISNTLPRSVTLQILEQGASGGTSRLDVARKNDEASPSILLAAGEIAFVYTAGVVGGRAGYIIVIDDESGKELFRRTFLRDELVQHKFRLTITEQGIEYSP